MNSNADFSKGKLFPLILRFSIPAAISLLITAVYNIVDRIFIGNFSGSTALASLSICFPLSFMMIASGLMCSAGGSTMFTLFRGNQAQEKANKAFGKQLLSCGFAFWIAQMAMGFIALVYNGQLGKYGGDIAISAYAIISSVMTFVIMPASGINQGIQPIIGFNYAAKNYNRVKQTFWKATLFSVGVTVVVWTITEIFPAALINLFGGGDELLSIGIPALRINFIVAPVLGFVMLATTFFQSIGKPTASSIITLIRQVVALIPLIYLAPMLFGTIGIFYAQPVSDVLATILSAALIIKAFKTMSDEAVLAV